MRQRTRLQQSFAPPSTGLSTRVTDSAAITFVGVGLRAVVTIGSTAILARLLTPEDFGLLTMAAIVTEFAALLSNLGIAQILVQAKRTTRLQNDTAFWFSIVLGVALALLMVLASYPAEAFFRNPKAGEIIRALSIAFVLEELTVIHNSAMHRLMLFRLEFAIQALTLLTRVATSIVLAWAGLGVWSLVLGTLVGRTIAVAMTWYFVPYLPRLRFSSGFISARWRTSGSYLGAGLLSHLNANVDYLIIGRRFGPRDLGYYQAAFMLGDELRNRLAGPLQRVLFPAYALLQNDPTRFQRGVISSITMLAAIVAPLGVGMAATAPEIIAILYGPQWLPAIPLLQVLGLVGAIRSLFSLSGSVLAARDRVGLNFLLQAVLTPLTFAAIFIGSLWGPIGVAYAMLAMSVPGAVAAHISLRTAGLGIGHLARAAAPGFLCAGIMAATLWALRHLGWLADLPVTVRFLTLVAAGASVYAAAFAVIARPVFRLVFDLALRIALRGTSRRS